jgi:hypothetical protein
VNPLPANLRKKHLSHYMPNAAICRRSASADFLSATNSINTFFGEAFILGDNWPRNVFRRRFTHFSTKITLEQA